jgi:hypothetical protein
MEKKPITMPMRPDPRRPMPKRTLIISIGNQRYQFQLETMLTPISDKPGQVIPIDREKQKSEL